MGFYKNVNASLSPTYAAFLITKEKYNIRDSSIIIPTIITRLHDRGLITDMEYENSRKKYGINWGSGLGLFSIYSTSSGMTAWSSISLKDQDVIYIRKYLHNGSKDLTAAEKMIGGVYDMCKKIYRDLGFECHSYTIKNKESFLTKEQEMEITKIEW